MTATTFSRQNDASLRVSTTYYWENLVLVVILVLESKGLYFWEYAKNLSCNLGLVVFLVLESKCL